MSCSSPSCDREINYMYATINGNGTYCSQLCLSQTEYSDNCDTQERGVSEMSKEFYYASNPLNSQTGGDHYKRMNIQPVEYITANELSYLQGNVIKYISRYKNKNGKEDLEKAKHYIDLIIETEYKE